MEYRIRIAPYIMDHAFGGKVVLPAVESLQHLAAAVACFQKKPACRVMSNAVFGKFLKIIPGAKELNVFVDWQSTGDGWCFARLLTREKMYPSAIVRTMEHAVVFFQENGPLPAIPYSPRLFEGSCQFFKIDARKVYRELVPFGPAFHNLTGMVTLAESGAEAWIMAPDMPEAQGVPDSSLVLDAAFHAACVWTQRYLGFAGFPVGFSLRVAADLACPGEICMTRLIPAGGSRGQQNFDLWIWGDDGRICEYVKDLCMRDVFAGQRKAPAWIKNQD